MKSRSQRGAAAVPKPVRIAVVAVFGVALAWLLLINVVLWSGLVQWLVSAERKGSTVRLDYGFAWCVWPTHVHVSGLRLDIDTYPWQLELELPEAEVDIAVWELLHRRFHTRSIRAEDVAAVFRLKLEPGVDDMRRLVGFAPPRGLPAPIRDSTPPPDRQPPDKAWSIELDDVHVGVRSLWINETRGEIEGTIIGGMITKAGWVFGVRPSRLDIDAGRVWVGNEPALQGVAATIDLHLLDYDPRSIRGADTLRQLSARVDGRARTLPVGWTRTYVSGVSIGQGEGTLACSFTLHSGVLATGSRVEYETQALEARREQMTLRGAVRVVATVAEEREGVRSQARVTLSGLEGHIVARAAERRKRWLRADEVTGFVAASQTDLAAGKWRVVDAAIGMPRFDLSNLGAVGKLGDALTLEGGAGRGKFSVARPKDGGWRGDIDFAFTRLGLRTSDLALDTSGSLRAKVAMDDALQRFRLDPLRLDLRQVTVETQRGRSQSWLRLSRAALAWNSRAKRGKLRVHAGEIEDLRPVLIHGREKRTLLEEIPDLGLSAPVTFTLEVAYAAPRTFDVRLEQAKSPLLGVRGRYKRVGSESRGAFLIENARVGIVVGSKSELDVEVAVPDGWLQSKQRWINQR